jgi:hypothetical protein
MLAALRHGFRATLREWQMTLWLYGFSLFIGLLFLFPLKTMFSGLERRDVSSEMLSGLNLTVLQDLIQYGSFSVGAVVQNALWLGLAYILFTVFLSGGVIAVFRARLSGNFNVSSPSREHRLQLFWSEAAKHSGRFFRLFLLSLVSMTLPILTFILFSAFGSSLSETSLTEKPIVVLTVIGLILAAIEFFILQAIFDYARFFMSAFSAGAFKGFWFGVKTVLRHAPRVFGISLVMLLSLAALTGIYALLNFTPQSAGSVGVLFAVQQIFIVGRLALRNAAIASHLSFYESLPKPAPAEPLIAPPILDMPETIPQTISETIPNTSSTPETDSSSPTLDNVLPEQNAESKHPETRSDTPENFV